MIYEKTKTKSQAILIPIIAFVIGIIVVFGILAVLRIKDNAQHNLTQGCPTNQIYVDGQAVSLDELDSTLNQFGGDLQVLVEFDYLMDNPTSFSKDRTVQDWREQVSRFYYSRNVQQVDQMSLQQDYYIARYAPFFGFESPIDQDFLFEIRDLFETPSVKNIHLSSIADKDINPNVYLGTSTTRKGDDVHLERVLEDYIGAGNVDLYGDGVVIGILEPELADISHANFDNIDIVTNAGQGFATSDHATQVASIIAQIAPHAKILSAAIGQRADMNIIMQQMDWLIQNGANVINNSWGVDGNGSYDILSAYYDFVVNVTGVTQVVAISNSGLDLGNPELGRNIISVGSVDSNRQRSAFSSYRSRTQVDAPNIMTVGDRLIVRGFDWTPLSGTSFAAPQVTAIVGLLMQNNNTLKVEPHATKAILLTSTTPLNPDDGLERILGSGLDQRLGAGLLNLQKALNATTSSASIKKGGQGDTVFIRQIPIAQSTQFVASIVNLVNNCKDNDLKPMFSIYNIRLLDSNGKVIDTQGSFSQSNTTYNNATKIQATLQAGTYKLEVFMSSPKVNSTERVCVSMVNDI